VLPVTGIPLPFISFGGSSLVITMVAAGILINIARHPRDSPCTGHGAKARQSSQRHRPRLRFGPAVGSVRAARGIVIAGGGTGGHVVPSLQIARALVARGTGAGDH
jgi:hypothetical protein